LARARWHADRIGLQALATSGKFKPVAFGQIRTAGDNVGGIDSLAGLMSNFQQFDRATGFLLPPSLDEWLPERHLARFIVEVIDGLDLLAVVNSYRGSGSAS
jgi:hypothetical protein